MNIDDQIGPVILRCAQGDKGVSLSVGNIRQGLQLYFRERMLQDNSAIAGRICDYTEMDIHGG